MRSLLFWDFKRPRLVVICRRFGTKCLSHLQGSSGHRKSQNTKELIYKAAEPEITHDADITENLLWVPVGSFETSVMTHKTTQSDIPEDLNTQLYRRENVQRRKSNCLQWRRSASAVLKLKFLSATQLATRHELSGRH